MRQPEAPDRKPVPVTVIVGLPPLLPLWRLAGLKDAIVGRGLGAVIVKERELEGPPPGVGFETVTWTLPGVVRADTGTVPIKKPWLKTWIC